MLLVWEARVLATTLEIWSGRGFSAVYEGVWQRQRYSDAAYLGDQLLIKSALQMCLEFWGVLKEEEDSVHGIVCCHVCGMSV